MKKLRCFSLLMILVLAGCGDGSAVIIVPEPVYEVEIISDQPSDGDIALGSVQQVFTINNDPDTLFFGIDSLAPNLPEYRAFLDFPLDGSTGAPVIPSSVIPSAELTHRILPLWCFFVLAGTISLTSLSSGLQLPHADWLELNLP